MIRPRNLSPREFFDLPNPDRERYLFELKTWEESPEGIAEKADREARRKAKYEAALPAKIRAILNKTGVPALALDVLAERHHETVAITAVRGATDIVVLSGGCGCGKTIAAASWLHDYVASAERWEPGDDGDHSPVFRGPAPVWVTAGQLARTNHYDQAAFDQIAKAARLVIDDLGAEFNDAKGFFAAFMDEIINVRYAAARPTVMTTNLDAVAFSARYGVRIVDRIREAGRFMGCGDVSLRRRPGPPSSAPTLKLRDVSIGHYPASPEHPTKTGRLELP